MIPNLTRQAYNVISVNSHPIWPVIYARSNLTGGGGGDRIPLVELGVNPLRLWPPKPLTGNVISMDLHPNQPASISLNFHPIWPVISARSNSTGQIGCKSMEIMTTKFDQVAILCKGRHTTVISVNLHPIWPVIYARLNSTGQIGCKSIEIMTTKFDQVAILCRGRHTNVISVNLHPIWPVFHARSNSTGQIGSKFIEIDASWIHWDDTQFDQVAILCTGRHTNVISVNLHPFWPVFFMPGRIRLVEFNWGDRIRPPLKLGGNHWDDIQFDVQAGIQM